MNAVPSCAADAPGREHRRHAATGGDAARGDERAVGHRAHELEQREQPDVARRGGVGGAAVAARLDALHHQRVGSALSRRPTASAGVVTVTHTAHPAAWSCATTVGVGAAERERHDRHLLLAGERELLLPAVVVVAGLAELHAEALRVARPARRA